MKKTALTFGLFSLVAAATSFANPTTSATAFNEDSNIVMPIDGGATGGQKKHDFHQSLKNDKQLDFSSVNQSIGSDKKVD
ncbi:hypothetical protein [Flavobacterium defluvii]|uniref:Uncharacterized protein n=1 Tax=Flavobacterium defluvii TaxID=370979 RepID=A0A1M5L981_9FLAO|nr:hypothetical protein [Flavobacterium defluvii]SHG61548.1 hypothetical protein SAMN05443663_103307 [Flavobacterium defluvii]